MKLKMNSLLIIILVSFTSRIDSYPLTEDGNCSAISMGLNLLQEISHDRLQKTPKLGLQYSGELDCSILDYLNNFAVRFIDIGEKNFDEAYQVEHKSPLVDVMASIDEFLLYKQDLFFIRVGVDKDNLKNIEKSILNIVKDFQSIKLLPNHKLQSFPYVKEATVISKGFNVILLHELASEIDNLDYFIKASAFIIEDTTTTPKNKWAPTNKSKLQTFKSSDDCERYQTFSFLYVEEGVDPAILRQAWKCGLITTMKHPERMVVALEDTLIHFHVRDERVENLKNFKWAWAYLAYQEHADDHFMLELRFEPSCQETAEPIFRKAACRREFPANSIFLGKEVSCSTDMLNTDICPGGELITPFSYEEIEELLQLLKPMKDLKGKASVWCSLYIEGSNHGLPIYAFKSQSIKFLTKDWLYHYYMDFFWIFIIVLITSLCYGLHVKYFSTPSSSHTSKSPQSEQESPKIPDIEPKKHKKDRENL